LSCADFGHRQPQAARSSGDQYPLAAKRLLFHRGSPAVSRSKDQAWACRLLAEGPLLLHSRDGPLLLYKDFLMSILFGVHQISKAFGARPLFQGISFSVEAGERIGLIG